MYIQLIVDILITIFVIYLVYKWLIKPILIDRANKRLELKAQKLRELKEKEVELKGEVEVTEELIDKEENINELSKELEELEKKEKGIL